MRLCRSITLTLCLLIVAAPTLAYDLGKVQINGFVSQGYIQSEGNNIFTADSTDGTFQFNEFGLTVNTDVTEKLHIGAQFLARDLGDYGNNEVTLDWGYGDYRCADWFGVRAGKIKLPIGLYNEGRDTDILRPMVFLPQSLYDEMRRDVINAVVGGGVYGYLPAGKVGAFHYNVVLGESDIPPDSFVSEYFRYLVNERLTIAGLPPILEELNYDSDYTASASLVYQAPVKGLRFGLTAMASEGTFAMSFNSAFPAPALPANKTISLELKNFYVLSAEYVAPAVTISAECYRLDRIISIFGQPVEEGTVREGGGYLLASVPLPLVPGLSVNGVYDLFYSDLDRRTWVDWSKDLGFGVRYDPNEYWTIKAEYHDVLGAGRTYSNFNQDGEVKDWSYWLVKTSFNF